MKNLLLTLAIAIAVTILVPRTMHEAAALAVRAGIALIRLGLILHPGYDADLFYPPQNEPPSPGQDAAAQPALSAPILQRHAR